MTILDMVNDKNRIDEFLVPASESVFEIKVKGSKFIASIVPARTKTQAENIYLKLKKKYYNATHNCFAYRIDALEFRYSDDGEPSGTAGKPIYQVLEGKGLHQVLCVVTRYYGGTKLGTGGLIRAYSNAANEALSLLPLKTLVRTIQLELRFSYDFENLIRKLLSDFRGSIQQSDYSDKIKMLVAVPASKTNSFMDVLTEKTNSMIKINRV